MTSQVLEQIAKAKKSSDTLVRIDINVYGPRHKAMEIGDALSTHKAWLQRPSYFRRQCTYDNPQVLDFPGLGKTTTIQDIREKGPRKKALSHGDRLQTILNEVHDRSGGRGDQLARALGDSRLKTPLLEYAQLCPELLVAK